MARRILTWLMQSDRSLEMALISLADGSIRPIVSIAMTQIPMESRLSLDGAYVAYSVSVRQNSASGISSWWRKRAKPKRSREDTPAPTRIRSGRPTAVICSSSATDRAPAPCGQCRFRAGRRRVSQRSSRVPSTGGSLVPRWRETRITHKRKTASGSSSSWRTAPARASRFFNPSSVRAARSPRTGPRIAFIRALPQHTLMVRTLDTGEERTLSAPWPRLFVSAVAARRQRRDRLRAGRRRSPAGVLCPGRKDRNVPVALP